MPSSSGPPGKHLMCFLVLGMGCSHIQRGHELGMQLSPERDLGYSPSLPLGSAMLVSGNKAPNTYLVIPKASPHCRPF